jgi:hypothetical protein
VTVLQHARLVDAQALRACGGDRCSYGVHSFAPR